MISDRYKDMLNEKSVIRQMAEFASKRGGEIGYENVFDFSLGNPSVPTPHQFTDACVDMLENCEPKELHGYSQSQGIPAVRAKVAESLNHRFGMAYTAEHIFMTAGAAGAVAHALRCVTQPGDEVITFAPYFPEYGPYVNMTGDKLKVVPADTETFQINFEQFDKMLTPSVTAVLVNSPNNPSGIVYSTSTIKKLADLMNRKQAAFRHDIFLISDEPYREIIFDGTDSPYITKYYDNSISCYSFSKALSVPGERIGYLAVNPNCTDALLISQICAQISRGIGHNCPASLMQLAISESLDVTADLSVYEENMNILYDGLTELGFQMVKPGGTFYMFPKALEEDAVRFCEKAKKYDIILVPGDSFGCPGYFRIAYCIEKEKVVRSLAAFRKFVKTEYDI